MKLNELINSFTIYLNNEENKVYESFDKPCLLDSFSEREQVIIRSLVQKSLLSKVQKNGYSYVVKNDY